MLGANVLRDLDVDDIVRALPTYTVAGREAMKARLSVPLTDVIDLQKRQNQIREIKANKPSNISALRAQLRDTEDDVRSVANAASDKRQIEYYTQILWAANSRFAWLNSLGWLNEAIVFFRTIFLPGISVLLPLFVFLAPLVFYNLVLNEPLTMRGYFNMLQTSIKKAMPSVLGKPRFAGSGGVLEVGEQFVHVGASIAMFAASIWNQVSAALSMRSVVADMRRRADAVHRFAKATVELGAALGVSTETVVFQEAQLGLFGDAWNSPAAIHALLTKAGELDMLAAIATAKRTCFPSLDASGIEITDLYHPAVQPKARIYNSLSMSPASNSSHVLLTGPNRGGKSTVLKSLGCAVLMAQTVGIVFGRKASFPVFNHIITALAPQDVVGKLSLFEAEIEFAKDVKLLASTANTGTIFLMMDEIFHGTNAHDGVEASQVFLDGLYATKVPIFSIVSTHYMDLPARYGPAPVSAPVSSVSSGSSSESKKGLTQNLCMDASVDPSDPDRLVYTYKLKEGVNRFSSVREILRERGLLRSTIQKNNGVSE